MVYERSKMATRLYNHTTPSREEILARPVVGVIHNNWRRRLVTLYQCNSPWKLYMVGRAFDDSMEVITEEDIGLNEKIAMDYWKHGKKVYIRD